VRGMEVRANEAFDVYRELYYEGGVSSVYFWNLDDGFAGVVLLKKGEFPFPSSPPPLLPSFSFPSMEMERLSTSSPTPYSRPSRPRQNR
ncbi:hypothetical protein IMZ48_47260, partial [Candidatus Bathyarchaeota archaeon]|nr:hypothetical protein [Candidatus Bathyarchaeota archaeon]